MKSTDLEGRIRNLDERFYDYSFPHGITVIDYHCFTAPERELLKRWRRIGEKYDHHVPESAINEHKEVIDALIHVLWGRTFDT